MRGFFIFLFLLIGTATNKNLFANENYLPYLAEKTEIDSKAIISKSQIKSLVIISCSGKSGSTTLQHSFRTLGVKALRCHVINEQMHNLILQRSANTNIILIDSFRDVISRKISSYFHHLTKYLKMSQEKIISKYKKDRVNFLKFIQKDFQKKIFKIGNNYAFKHWKDFNYDCLNDALFNFQKRYQLKQIGNLYFVNLRFEDIKDWEEIIKSLPIPINLKHFKIVAANQAKNKWYSDLYQDFLKHFTLSKTSFDTILSEFSEKMAHFYTEKEIEDFINKWKPHLVD